jgi:putative RecB family exonuclease
MHAAQELFYRSMKDGRNQEPLKPCMRSSKRYCESRWKRTPDTPVIWKKNMPDQAGTVAMGQSMLTAFYESIDLSGYAVVEVELPLSARLYSDDGLPTDFMLVGILDLLLMDENAKPWWSITKRPLNQCRRFQTIVAPAKSRISDLPGFRRVKLRE